MLAVKGTIKGNTVVVEDGENLSNYDGKDVILTILDYPYKQQEKEKINLDRFVKPTTRGENADKYIEGLRANDRV